MTPNSGGSRYAGASRATGEHDGGRYRKTPAGSSRGKLGESESSGATGGRAPPSTPMRAPLPASGLSKFEVAIPVSRWSPAVATPTTPVTPSSSSDSQLTLIYLAESHIEAAHRCGYRAAVKGGMGPGLYYGLLSCGLRALEIALQGRLQPRMEAMVRLRYASILHEETENANKAEDILNKGIILAQRGNFVDIKYSMQHLLVCMLLRTTPKAALKMLNSCIIDSETLEIIYWTYSFRFLRCSILMEDSPVRDELGVVSTLQKISNTAVARHDYGIFVLANLMEAMISILPGAEGVEAANRALAKANSVQLERFQGMEQLGVLRQMLDITCSLLLGKTLESEAKLKSLHGMLDESQKGVNWVESGEFEVPVNSTRPGKPMDKLRFKWLTKEDVFVLGYFISGLCKFQRNVDEGGKGERFLQEGLRSIERLLSEDRSGSSSLVEAMDKSIWRQSLKCYVIIYHTFLLCLRTDWDAATKGLDTLQKTFSALPPQKSMLGTFVAYLRATIAHGTNDLGRALDIYEMIYSSIPSPDSELSMICKLNSIFILRSQDAQKAELLMSEVEKRCSSAKNTLIKAAYMVVKATENGELVKTKNYLSMALQLATQTTNQQLTFIVLSFMCHRFFSGVVSDQAEKSAKAALQNASRGRDSLWTLVAGEMYADCLARKGNEAEAARQRQLNEDLEKIVVANLGRHGSTGKADNTERTDGAGEIGQVGGTSEAGGAYEAYGGVEVMDTT